MRCGAFQQQRPAHQCHFRVYAHADQADGGPFTGYVAMFFDAKGPTFRHERYAEYKANRPPMPDDLVQQLPWIRKVTEAFNIPVFEMPGYEADDLIGTLAQHAEKNGFRVVMVTGDKDFMQLVTERCTIWDPMKDKVHRSCRHPRGLRPGAPADDRRHGPFR
jgi:5'-3' exonuclease